VAVVGVRGARAGLRLPPARALVRAKRSLGGLPGGGGTPLAAALDATAQLARAVRRDGRTPVAVLLTDGRANVARDGSGGRAKAGEEALEAARLLAGDGVTALVIDVSPRPGREAAALAEALDARYLPLPRADAGSVAEAVKAAGAEARG